MLQVVEAGETLVEWGKVGSSFERLFEEDGCEHQVDEEHCRGDDVWKEIWVGIGLRFVKGILPKYEQSA